MPTCYARLPGETDEVALGRGASDLEGLLHIDTTVGAVIVHDGAVWRNAVTGAAV
jgi:hypothetical protein